MPYIVTTKRLRRAPVTEERYVANLSRRAVATLEEAIRECWRLAPDPVPDKVKHALNGLREPGGTITLPDGTVIEIKRVVVMGADDAVAASNKRHH